MTEYNQARAIDLSPAKWIWVPSERTLSNTFALFRKKISINKPILSAKGYILGSSRYLATLNGKRIAWGPAPADPRYEEADQIDITEHLVEGENELAVKVCFFGFGDGTWVVGNPGLIYNITVVYQDGTSEQIISDKTTLAAFDNSYPAGQYKRWFLRSLQEEHDFRLEGREFYLPAMELPGKSFQPSAMNGYGDYISDATPSDDGICCIRKREIPFPTEEYVYGTLTDMGTVQWHRPIDDWFRFRPPGSFTIKEGLDAEMSDGAVSFYLKEEEGVFLTYRLPEQGVGFVTFEITAPEGCIVEAMIQESRDTDKTLWLDTHFYSWSRHTLKQGETKVITFEYESFLWLQLHIHGVSGPVRVKNVGMLRRYAPLAQPRLAFENPDLQKLFSACVNTLKNSIIETATDGMGRERQQYGGDCTHQIYAFSYLYSAGNSLVKRYFETYTDGISLEGYYMDCWPATDRTQRLSQVQLGLSPWAPIADHPIQVIFAIYQNYMETGDLSLIRKTAFDFVKFTNFMLSKQDHTGLIPAEGLNSVYVWLDHQGFPKQRDKCCAFNLYFASMIKHALVPILKLIHEDELAEELIEKADQIIRETNLRYYDQSRKSYIDNLPYIEEDGYITVSDRTLATGILFDTAPFDHRMGEILVNNESYVTRSYPANIVWRYKALAKAGYPEAVATDIMEHFFTMPSVSENNALQEYWQIFKGERCEMSHCPLAPLQMLYEVFLGIVSTAPAFRSFKVSPSMYSLCKNTKAAFTVTTVSGNIDVLYENGGITLTFPETQTGEIQIGEKTLPLQSGHRYLLTE